MGSLAPQSLSPPLQHPQLPTEASSYHDYVLRALITERPVFIFFISYIMALLTFHPS